MKRTARIMDVFAHELAHTCVIHIGRATQARDPLFTRVLHLVQAPVPPQQPGAAQGRRAPRSRWLLTPRVGSNEAMVAAGCTGTELHRSRAGIRVSSAGVRLMIRMSRS